MMQEYYPIITIDETHPLGLGHTDKDEQPVVQSHDNLELSRITEGRFIKKAIEPLITEACEEMGVSPKDLGYDMNTLTGLVAMVVVTQTGDPTSKQWRSVLSSFKTTIQTLIGSMNDIHVATCGLLMQANEPANVSGPAEIVIHTSPDVSLSVSDSNGVVIERPTKKRIADAISSIRAELFSLPMGRGAMPTLNRRALRDLLTKKGFIK